MPRSNTQMLSNVHVYNTLVPYIKLDYNPITYTTCRDYEHVSRYRGLRQIIHNEDSDDDRFIAPETPNPFETHQKISYHEVQESEKNRLDIIAYKALGSANYAWVIAYFNGIEDGCSCYPGQSLKIPPSITSLFDNGEMLASVSAVNLNLGSE